MTGWDGLPEVPVNGVAWPLEFAARMLDVREDDLRALVRIARLEPSGVIPMAEFRRQGRHPRAYNASTLIKLVNAIRETVL